MDAIHYEYKQDMTGRIINLTVSETGNARMIAFVGDTFITHFGEPLLVTIKDRVKVDGPKMDALLKQNKIPYHSAMLMHEWLER